MLSNDHQKRKYQQQQEAEVQRTTGDISTTVTTNLRSSIAATPSTLSSQTGDMMATMHETVKQNEINNNSQLLDSGSCDMMSTQYSALYNKTVLFWPCPSMKVSRPIFHLSRARTHLSVIPHSTLLLNLIYPYSIVKMTHSLN